MNKTVNINLGGMFFHIDEEAYQKLSRYFDAIKRSLTNSSGQDEIIKDIEMRVSELLTEKQKSDKHVVSLKDVDEVITIMGQPEDYRIDDEGSENKSSGYQANTNFSKLKKLYRDRETGMIGGVLSGLGHYFGIDKVWLRIGFLLLIWLYGTGFIAYIILWIVMPEATTTSEKIEMTGEPVNISNIEKKVREEFENVSEKLKTAGGKITDEAKNFNENYGEKIQYQSKKVGSSFGDFILTILKIFAKFIGALIVIIASVTLIALLISLFTLGSTSFLSVPWLDYFNTFNYTNTSMWFVTLLTVLAIGIPFFFFLILGLKILVTNMKSIGNVAKYTLLAIWILSIGALITLGVRQATEVAFENKVVEKQLINLNPKDTLFIKFKNNDYYAKNINNNDDFRFVQDSANHNLIYSNNIEFEIMQTDDKIPYIQIEKTANGKSFNEAKQRAQKIQYGFKVIGNQIILNNYLLTDVINKFRGQEVRLFLYLPEGTLFKADSSVQNYDRTNNEFFNLHFSDDKYVYQVKKDKIICLNCPPEETEEYNDGLENSYEENDTIQDIQIKSDVTINKNGITIKNDTISNTKNSIKELKINKDGIIIKTN